MNEKRREQQKKYYLEVTKPKRDAQKKPSNPPLTLEDIKKYHKEYREKRLGKFAEYHRLYRAKKKVGKK